MRWNFFENTGKLYINFQVVDITGHVFKVRDGIISYMGKKLGPGTIYSPLGLKVIDLRKHV